MVFKHFYVNMNRCRLGQATQHATSSCQHDALMGVHVHEMTLCVTFGAPNFRNHLRSVLLCSRYRRLGKKRRLLTGNPSPAPTHPHRTHDTTDQWRKIRLVAGPILEKCLLSRARFASTRPHVSTMLSLARRHRLQCFR